MTADRFKTREPDARFQSQVPDFKLKKREPKRKYEGAVSGNDQPAVEAQPEPSIPVDTQTTPKQHPNDTKERYRTWRNEPGSADTRTTPKQHPNNTNILESPPVMGFVAEENSGSELISKDTETTLKRHSNDTDVLNLSQGLDANDALSVPAGQDKTALLSNDTQTTPKQHPNDTNPSNALDAKGSGGKEESPLRPVESIWAITGLRRSVLFGLFDIARERGGTTNILGITYDEVAVRSKVKSTSVRTTMKRLRDEGWITIIAKRGNNRTISVDVCYAYQQFASDLSGSRL